MIKRIKLAYHVFRGRPLIYGTHFIDGDGLINLDADMLGKVRVVGNHFDRTKTA